jgi:hypothetical protein
MTARYKLLVSNVAKNECEMNRDARARLPRRRADFQAIRIQAMQMSDRPYCILLTLVKDV